MRGVADRFLATREPLHVLLNNASAVLPAASNDDDALRLWELSARLTGTPH